MLTAILFALVLSDDEPPGTYINENVFLPLAPEELLIGRGLLLDFPDSRIPIQRFFRFVSSFMAFGNATFGLQEVFGQLVDPKDDKNFIWNFSSHGFGGRISVEDQPTFMHLCELDMELEAGNYNLCMWAKVTDENRFNQSVLLYNQSTNFYEVSNITDTVGSVVLYVFFIAVLGGILFLIFSKDQVKPTSQPNKKTVLDYADIHKAPVEKTRSPSPPAKGGQGEKPSKRRSSPK
jgi:hypothetical protein